ncbi:MAG: prevent-host-death protein [Sedimenticola sp.]
MSQKISIIKIYIPAPCSARFVLEKMCHSTLLVIMRSRDDFVVVSADDWERDHEILYAIQNSDIMRKMADSMGTHMSGKGYKPTAEEVDEIISV